MSDTYRFTGETEEIFPDPPIARLLQPGDVVELEKDPEHPRLQKVAPRAKPIQPTKEGD